MTEPLSLLADAHKGGTCVLVGKGPSLAHLSADDLEGDLVLTLAQAIIAVEAVEVGSPVYSLQKDGCHVGHGDRQCDGCKGEPPMVRPQRAALIVHAPESGMCFPDYEPRYSFDTAALLALPEGHWSNSVTCAVRIARLLGATRFRLVSFDACTGGDHRTYEAAASIVQYACNQAAYPWACQCLKEELAGLPYSWVTPCAA